MSARMDSDQVLLIFGVTSHLNQKNPPPVDKMQVSLFVFLFCFVFFAPTCIGWLRSSLIMPVCFVNWTTLAERNMSVWKGLKGRLTRDLHVISMGLRIVQEFGLCYIWMKQEIPIVDPEATMRDRPPHKRQKKNNGKCLVIGVLLQHAIKIKTVCE